MRRDYRGGGGRKGKSCEAGGKKGRRKWRV